MKPTYDNLVNKLTDHLLKKDGVCMDADACRFGIEIMLLKLLHFVSYLVIAACMKRTIEFIIIFFVFYAFRRNTGGYHARTRTGCYLFSCTAITAALAATGKEMNLWFMAGLALCELAVLFWISPVENENRPLEEDEISCFRKRFYLLSVVFAIGFILTQIAGYRQLVWLYTIGLSLAAALAILGKIQEIRKKDI